MTTFSPSSERLLRFLNGLPVTANAFYWIGTFREELAMLLGDIDRITVSVNFNCDIRDPANYRPQLAIAQHARVVGEEERSQASATLQPTHEDAPIDRMIDELREKGYPFDGFHDPVGFAYYFQGEAYLGTILLWRRKGSDPIPAATIAFMEEIEPLVIFLLSDLVARHQHAEPDVRMFTSALQQLAEQVGLTRQEQRVVILQLFGHSYKEIAELLGVSVDGVKHHLKMIHRKTGTRSYTELFAKYFMPRLKLRDEEGEGEAEMGGEEILAQLEHPVFDEGAAPADEILRMISFEGIETVGDRLRRFGELAFDSMQEFARATKMAPSNLQKYLNGERDPGMATLQKIFAVGCNINGLLAGGGEVFADTLAGRALRRTTLQRLAIARRPAPGGLSPSGTE